MNDRNNQEIANELVEKIESGAAVNLSTFLNQLPEKERVDIARKMDQINADHRKTNKHLPDIQLSIATVDGESQLLDMNVKKGGKSQDIFNPTKSSMRDLAPGATAYVHVVGDSKDLWGFKDGSSIVYDSETGKETYFSPARSRTRK